MKDLLDNLKEVWPIIGRHPRFTAALSLCLFALFWLYRSRKTWAQICRSWSTDLYDKASVKSRWVFVDRSPQITNEWKYYTSETTGLGEVGDDIIWTLVSWPRLKPLKSFRIHGAVGMERALQESQTKLDGRWGIVHDPYSSIGPVPASGLASMLRRTAARCLMLIGSI
jgi:hypothetical protein